MDFTVRPGIEQDGPEMLMLWREMMDFHARWEPRFRPLPSPAGERAWERHLNTEDVWASEDWCVFVAETDGRLVGHIMGVMRDAIPVLEPERYGYVTDMVVDPSARRSGVGQALFDALNRLGARVSSEAGNNCPPVLIEANGLRGGSTSIHGDISSQFLSGLLMACPYAAQDVCLTVEGSLVSQPYVRMTLGVMSAFGVTVDHENLTRLRIAAGQRYQGREYAIEPDASAASYFWAAAAVTGGTITVQGLSRESLQGDFCRPRLASTATQFSLPRDRESKTLHESPSRVESPRH